ncbi:toxin-antitoxin system, toxin component [Streptomyces sp. NBC_00076]|uniref:toxin-antitoxin system, toxin component n=1 Tax=Streptomyces sp. NBC_00076 TaxID=2975642 RepID=UPI00324D358D
MSTRLRAMRQLSAQLVRNLQPASDQEIIPAIGQALTQGRGRPVRLRTAAFPPGIASGLWVDRTSHDLIAYEENTDPEHQLVIIGHEAWHMFQGHCSSTTAHGPTASRAQEPQTAGALLKLAAVLSEADDTELPPATRTDAGLHFAARADAHQVDEELEAELFGFRFATDVQAALAQARTLADPHYLAGRIQVSMAHRVPRS